VSLDHVITDDKSESEEGQDPGEDEVEASREEFFGSDTNWAPTSFVLFHYIRLCVVSN
jgi:hypothetical protein